MNRLHLSVLSTLLACLTVSTVVAQEMVEVQIGAPQQATDSRYYSTTESDIYITPEEEEIYLRSPRDSQTYQSLDEPAYSARGFVDDSLYAPETASYMQGGGSSSERYIRSPVFFDDATPQPTGTFDFRFRFDYVTEGSHAARGTDDDLGAGVTVVWGPCPNVEMSLDVPMNMGDGLDTGDDLDGNYDSTWGVLYRFWEEEGEWMPAFALSGKIRAPTGYKSQGIDGELRAILTRSFHGIRYSANGFLTTVNGNNDPGSPKGPFGRERPGRFGNDQGDGSRNFQWGVVLGMDMPLCPSEEWWFLFDYMHRSSQRFGEANMNLLQAAVEWKFTDIQSVHFSTFAGLDDNGDTPNWGATLAYTYELAY